MGTVTGVLLGATILRLLPEKLRFFDEYRLLIFGAALILVMRFRPEGLVPSARRAAGVPRGRDHRTMPEQLAREQVAALEGRSSHDRGGSRRPGRRPCSRRPA